MYVNICKYGLLSMTSPFPKDVAKLLDLSRDESSEYFFLLATLN